jgi:hypothetical protein
LGVFLLPPRAFAEVEGEVSALPSGVVAAFAAVALALSFFASPKTLAKLGRPRRAELEFDIGGVGGCTSTALYTGLTRACVDGDTRGGVVLLPSSL